MNNMALSMIDKLFLQLSWLFFIAKCEVPQFNDVVVMVRGRAHSMVDQNLFKF